MNKSLTAKERGEGILRRGNKYRRMQVHGEFKNKVESNVYHKRRKYMGVLDRDEGGIVIRERFTEESSI